MPVTQTITFALLFDKKEFFLDAGKSLSMRKTICLVGLLLWLSTSALADIEIRQNGSYWATIEDDGDIRMNGSFVGTIEDDGDVRKSGSYVGQVEEDGDIRKDGSYYGVIEPDGDLRIGGSFVGKIEPGGTIRLGGSCWGSASNLSCPFDTRKVAAVLVFFSSDF
jgi:hypothetical protein